MYTTVQEIWVMGIKKISNSLFFNQDRMELKKPSPATVPLITPSFSAAALPEKNTNTMKTISRYCPFNNAFFIFFSRCPTRKYYKYDKYDKDHLPLLYCPFNNAFFFSRCPTRKGYKYDKDHLPLLSL